MGGTAIVVEQFLISGGSNRFSVPLTFFDMLWYNFLPDQSLLLFEFPCPKAHFLETMVPHFKKSLSLTLPHFLPLAGNIIHSVITTKKPIALYTPDDAVSCTFAIYDGDDSDESIQFLMHNNNKRSSELYCLVPWLPPSKCNSDGSIACPVLALQVTLLPGQGVCVGFVTHHAVSDACTVVSFMRAWALIHRNTTINPSYHYPQISTKALLVEENCFPSYHRETVVDVNNLDSVYWDFIQENCSSLLHHERLKEISDPSFGKVRSTFILTKNEIHNLKKYYSILVGDNDKNYKPANHLSSFVVACALVWVCNARTASGEELVADDEPEYLGYMVDCRGRFMSPPLPANYFGNCVGPVIVELKHAELKGKNGFAIVVESIMETIRERVYGHGKGILEWVREWPEYQKLASKRQCWVAGSPKFDFYAVDFGWGRPKKFEALFTDIGDGAILLSKSRDFEGGLEIGLSKPKAHMEAFTAVFNKVLADISITLSFPINRGVI